MCYWPVEKSWLFPVCLRSCPTSSFKGCYESATLPLISFPRLSPPLKIKPVSQIISQANQRSLCIWGWEEKLAIKSSLRSLVGKKSCSLSFLNLYVHLESLQRAFFSPEIICYLGAIPATNNHLNTSPHDFTRSDNCSVARPGTTYAGRLHHTSLLYTK